MSRARTWRSSTAGPRIKSIGCRCWRQTPATSAVMATKAATTAIPIVFAVGFDPVALGLVASLARPGGNLTGINFLNNELVAKQLEFVARADTGSHPCCGAGQSGERQEHVGCAPRPRPDCSRQGAANPGSQR